MGITINSKSDVDVFGTRQALTASIAMGSSYPAGGEAFDVRDLFGLQSAQVDLVQLESPSGYMLRYDYTNEKVKAYAPAPPIRYDEVHSINAITGQITLDYPAAFIMNVSMTGGQNLKMRSTGLAISDMSASQCCLASQMAEGVRTQLTIGVGLAPDLLAGVNGGFTGNANSWTAGDGWAYDSNDIHKSAGDAGTLAHASFAPVQGKVYKVYLSFNADSFTAGSLTVTLGASTSASIASGVDTAVVYLSALDTTGLVITPTEDAVLELNTVYIVLMEAKVTYVTQAWKEVWDNLMQDESVTLSSAGAVSTAYQVAALMYFDQITATAAALTFLDQDDAAASGCVQVDFNDVETAGGNILTSHADQNEKVCKVTYLKNPGIGFLHDRAVDNEAATKAGADPYTNTFDYPILLWGYAGQMPVNGGTTQVLIDFTSTPEAGEAIIDYFTPGARGGGAPAVGSVVGLKSNLTGTGAYIWGTVDEIPRGFLEVKDGENLAALDDIKVFILTK